MAKDRRTPDNPRSPEHHELTGTGTPRSADEGLPQPDRHAGSQPAQAEEPSINRSGSGGSGGPATPDPSVEGSTGESMSELLSGDEQTLD